MLYSKWIESHAIDNSSDQQTAPITTVFLHGFLGSTSDWEAATQALSHHQIHVDLPCHGRSKYCEVDDFESTFSQIELTVLERLAKQGLPSNTPIVLVGYSLGARIAMYALSSNAFSKLNIQGAVFESGNFGLPTELEQEQRWENDKIWSRRFATESLEDVLCDWYQQDIFTSVSDEQLDELIDIRLDNLGSQLASMLRATSVAKQPYLLKSLQELTIPLLYICGGKDSKFNELAQASGLPCYRAENAGHNVHLEQPKHYAEQLEKFIKTIQTK